MIEISDEMLMAYADGQLADSDRRRVEAYLASDADGWRRLQVFIDTGPALARMLDEATARPMPSWIVETVRGARPAVASRHAAPRRSAGAKLLDGLAGFRPGPLLPMAVAASAALLIGTGIGWSLRVDRGHAPEARLVVSLPDGRMHAGPALASVLENSESGKAVPLDGFGAGSAATPVLSFVSRDTDVCRQYRVVVAKGSERGFEGLACRAEDGGWRVDVHTPAAVRAPSAARIAPASGGGASLVDAAVDRVLSGDAMSREEELELLKRRWLRPAPH